MPRLRPYVVCGGGWVGGEERRGEGRGGEGVGRGEDTDTDDDMDDMAGLRLRGNEHLSFISNQSEFYNVRVQCRSQQHHYRSHPPMQVLRSDEQVSRTGIKVCPVFMRVGIQLN